ncbi:hypothetical protein EDC14_10564 [Hydrogenispora ethanolica]|uniref:WD40 repeat protein n=1 Tax=Hydrogenispora ethanolica TaxID=1082276 RepID=A0A4V6NGK7_HYDET|nr:hypothetical protein [Hydrogenispora ethanolica]TCL55352.1 hypothetical protein EDC14_10564 [Hydrogenispora ethanolica]
MRKRFLGMIAIAVGISGLIAVTAIWLAVHPANNGRGDGLSRSVDTRRGRFDLEQVRKGRTLQLITKQSFENRAPFYLDKTGPSAGAGFTFMYYYSDRRSLFYRFNPKSNRPELCFDVKGNIDGGIITDQGHGVLYREMVVSNYLEGNLCHKKAGKPLKKILKRCNWYEVSPDRRKVIAGGIPFAEQGHPGRQVYLYDLERDILSVLPGAVCPDDWEDLLNFSYSWSGDSRYVRLEQKVFGSDSLRLLKNLQSPGANVSMFAWSPDGKELAFAVQTTDKAQYTISEEHRDLFLSNQLGIYNPSSQTVRYIRFSDVLITSIVWGRENGRIAATAVPLANAAAYVDGAGDPGRSDPLDLLLIDTAALKAEPLLTDIPVTEPAALAGDMLVYVKVKGGRATISAFQLSNRRSKDLLHEELFAAEVIEGRIYLAAASSVYRIEPGLRLTRLTAHSGEGELIIAPGWRKIVTGLADRIDVISF